MDETDNRQGLLYGALAKAQGGMVNPPKNREVQVRSEKGSYTSPTPRSTASSTSSVPACRRTACPTPRRWSGTAR